MSVVQISQMLKGVAVAALMLLPVPATSVTNTPSATPELPPAAAAADMNAGATAVEARQYDLAVKRLTRAIDSGALGEDALALAYHHRGIAHQKLGFDEMAVADYTHALDLNTLPREVTSRAYYNRALARTKSADLAGAELDYSHAIEFNPDYAAAYHNRANLERARADYPTAIRDYSVALSHLEGNERTLPLMGRALAHRNTGDIAAASSDLDEVISLDPTYIAAIKMRREIASLAVTATTVASNAPQNNDELETSSITPRHGEVISRTNQNGWQTNATRYASASAVKQPADDSMETGSLRDIDMVPAPRRASMTEATTEAEPTQVASLTPAAPVVNDAPASENQTSGRYKLQLGAFRSADIAAAEWKRIGGKMKKLTDEMSYTVEQADLGERGTYFRLQAGSFKTASDAKSKCSEFTAQKVDCIVVAR
ncbi:MAG: SPOR domain-containing protein [Parvibaculaceae bacterium]